MLVTVAAMVTDASDEHPKKASLSTLVTATPMVTDASDEQPRKAPKPMLVTEIDMLSDTSAVQLWKALSPTLDGINTWPFSSGVIAHPAPARLGAAATSASSKKAREVPTRGRGAQSARVAICRELGGSARSGISREYRGSTAANTEASLQLAPRSTSFAHSRPRLF